MKQRAVVGVWALAAVLAAPAALANGLAGTVVQVLDGQTLQVAPAGGGAPVTVRIRNLIVPGTCLPGGPEALAALKERVDKLAVRVEGGAADRNGRLSGTLMLGKTDIGGQLVEEGFAWSVRTKWDRGPYVKQERVAKALGRGLHGMGLKAPQPGQPFKPCP